MFDTPYNREVAREMAHLNRKYARHVGDVGDGAGISGGILTGGRRKIGGEFELEGAALSGGRRRVRKGRGEDMEGGNILDMLKLPFKLIGLGEDAEGVEGAALSGGRRKRAAHKKRGGNILDMIKLPFKLIGLGEDAEGVEGAAVSGGRRRVHKKRGGILTGGEETGGILTGGRRKRAAPKKHGGNIVRSAIDLANMFYDPISDTPLAKIVGPQAISAFKDVASDVIGAQLGLGRPKHKKAAGTRAAAAQNPWIAHVKKFAAQHGISYREALRSPACKSSYRG